jgi:hypothetical protein
MTVEPRADRFASFVRGPGAAAVLGVALVAVVFGVVLRHLWYPRHAVTDLSVFYLMARRIATGEVPYLDFAYEYPPLSLLLYLAPGHLRGDLYAEYWGYQRWFTAEMLFLAAATCVTVVGTAWSLWGSRRTSAAAAVLFAAALAALGTIVQDRIDMAVALLVAGVVLLLVRRRLTSAAAIAGIGVALKLAPGLLMILILPLARSGRRAVSLAIVCLAASTLPFLPFLVVAPDGVWVSLWRQTRRPLEIESAPASVALLGDRMGWAPVDVGWSFGSFGVASRWTESLAIGSNALSIISLLVAGVLIVRARRVLRSTPALLPVAAMTVLLAAIAPGKVLSPQYLVWLVPLVVLVALDDVLLGAVAFGSLVMTGIEFPALFLPLSKLDPQAIAVVAVRNALLLAALAIGLWRLWCLGRTPVRSGWSLARRWTPR